MTDFATLRRRMVDNQIRPGAVTDLAVIDAFLAVPREIFVDRESRPFAYADRDLQMPASGRRMMAPAQLARLIQTLPIRPADTTMVVGCGAGYSAAILARLADRVIALEEDESLVALARANIAALGAANVTVVQGALTGGYPAAAPYGAILVEGAVEVGPEALIGQLRPEGGLAVVEQDDRISRAVLYERVGDDYAKWPQFDAWATPLPGFQRKREFVF